MKTNIKQVLFIDADVLNAQSIIDTIPKNIDVFQLDNQTSTLDQIATILDRYHNLEEIHIISHGAEGKLAFANGSISNSNVNDYSAELKRIGSALSATGDLLLYGCDVAKGDAGLAFINLLSVLTDADVAASDDLTGNSFAWGDWVLESTVGSVEADAMIKSDIGDFGTKTLAVTPVTFAPAQTFSTGNNTYSQRNSVVLGDVNNDSYPDIISTANGNDKVTVFLNNGTGGFATKRNFSVGDSPNAVEVGDFNKDGYLDIVVAADGNNSNDRDNLTILRGDGTGNFTTQTTLTVGIADNYMGNPESVELDDLNGDGYLDIVTQKSGNNNAVITFLNNGAGDFSSSQTAYPVIPSSYRVTMGDVNNDGLLDAISTSYDSNCSILLGQSNGKFAVSPVQITTTETGWTCRSVVINDFNGDGKNDLVAINDKMNWNSSLNSYDNFQNFSVLLGIGNGKFQDPKVYSIKETSLGTIHSGDINGDGTIDLALVSEFNQSGKSNNKVLVFLNDGAGNFGSENQFTVDSSPSDVAIGDVNADGKPDLVTVQDVTVSVLLNNINTKPNNNFNIEFNFDSTVTQAIKDYFETAALRWESIITTDVPDYNGVDDIVIDVSSPYIDGVGKILGQAGPRKLRPTTYLPTTGIMKFDSSDVENMIKTGTFVDTILHEIGHVLGIGALWGAKDLKSDFSNYIGSHALDAYRSLLGDPTVKSIPLEETGGSGTAGSHWAEKVFGDELMTGWTTLGKASPLSKMTIGAIQDLGYTVDYSKADPYIVAGNLVTPNSYLISGSFVSDEPTTGDDKLLGTINNDTLSGLAGNDTIFGLSGNDTLNGDAGTDTAFFSGVYADYQFSIIPRGLKVTDTRAGNDGIDELYEIEMLQFSDKTVNVLDLNFPPTRTVTFTGYDLFNWLDQLLTSPLNKYSSFYPLITSEIGNYANENWVAKTKGSDSYDPESSKQQTIALKSTEGSTLTFIKQPDKTNWDFLSSDGLVKLHMHSADKFADKLGFGSIITYTNLGGPGKSDDVNITYNDTYNVSLSSTEKNGNYSATISDTLTYSYIGNGYNVNVLTKTNIIEKQVYSTEGSIFSRTSNTTITKYNLLNSDSGFNINLTGVTSHSEINNNGVESDKTSFSKVALTTTDYKLTGVNVSYDTPHDENGNAIRIPNLLGFWSTAGVVNVTSMQDALMANVVPNLMNGNNNIAITNKNGVQIDAGVGKDTVIGAAGDDTIIGGAGSDKLTGGKGTDTFSFSNTDFYSENTNGDSIFNKSADTITDFNLKEHDVLDFGDLGELSFYAKLADAKADNAHLFYVKGSGSIYLNTSTTDGFTPTVIITLTGKPALNAEGTDFNGVGA